MLGALHIMWLVSHPAESLTSHFAQVFVEAPSASETCPVSIWPSSFEATLLPGSQVGLFFLDSFLDSFLLFLDSFLLSASLTCPLPASSLQPTHRLIIIFQKQIKKKKTFLHTYQLPTLSPPSTTLGNLRCLCHSPRVLFFASPPSAPCSPCRSSSQTVHAPDQGPFPSSPSLPSEPSPLSGLPAPGPLPQLLSLCAFLLSSFPLLHLKIWQNTRGLFQSSL